MTRILGWGLAMLVAAVAVVAIYVYQQVITLDTTPVTDDVYAIHGLGGNVGVLRTAAGAVVVDTMTFPIQGREIRKRAEALGGGPVQAIINTHYHLDHTHGNPAFAAGLPVHATERTLAYLEAVDADFWSGEAAGTKPNDTFRHEQVVEIGGKTIRLLHPGRGHTDGDLVALFVEDRVLHTGDLFFNGSYPNIDLEAGGSVQAWSDTIDRILELDFDQVIPGHGPVTDRAGLRQFQTFVRELAAVGAEARRNGWDLAKTQADARLEADAGYSEMSIPLVLRLDRDFVIRRAWEETNGSFERIELPGGAE